MAERAHLTLRHQGQAITGVDAGGNQQFLTQAAAQFLHVRVHRKPGALEEDVARQRVTVGVQAGGTHGDDRIAHAYLLWAQQLVCFDHADGGGGHIVVIWVHHTWVLSGLAAQQGCTGLDAAFGDAADDVCDFLRHHFSGGDIVLQEQWLSTAHDEVVDAHGHQVDADGVVLIHRLGDNKLRTHAV